LDSIKCPECKASISEDILETVDKDRTEKLVFRKAQQINSVSHVSGDRKYPYGKGA